MNNNINFSIYTTLFNIEKHNFPWCPSLENFVKFCKEGDEIVVAVNKSEDNTLQIIKDFAAENPLVKVIETNFDYNDIEMDGKIKNAALQATKNKIKIQMDADEGFVLSQRQKWEEYAETLMNQPHVDCLLIPSVDLFGSKDKIRANHEIGQKFRMHKGGFRRGVWNGARRGDKIDTSKSDTTEIIDMNGDLVRSYPIVPPQNLHPLFCFGLNKYIFTIHFGYLSFEHRININNKLWADHWALRSGGQENVATRKEQLDLEPTIKHNLSLI